MADVNLNALAVCAAFFIIRSVRENTNAFPQMALIEPPQITQMNTNLIQNYIIWHTPIREIRVPFNPRDLRERKLKYLIYYRNFTLLYNGLAE